MRCTGDGAQTAAEKDKIQKMLKFQAKLKKEEEKKLKKAAPVRAPTY